MASGRPAGAPVQKRTVVTRPNINAAGDGLLLKMALQTQGRIPLAKHLGVHRTVRLVAGGATLPDGFVLENERSALGRVATAACVKLGGQ